MKLQLIIASVVSILIIGYLVWRFAKNYRRYRYIGSTFVYLLLCFVACYICSLCAVYNPSIPPEEEVTLLSALGGSIFSAIKMFAVSFEYKAIAEYLTMGPAYVFFAITYVSTSGASLAFVSLAIILSFAKGIIPKWRNFFRYFKPSRNIHYIFTDSGVTISSRLANELNKKRDIVRVVVTRKSQKTQEGTEFKDALIAQKFDVITEDFTDKYGKLIYRKSLSFINKHRKTYVYGMFSNDEDAIVFAKNFTSAVRENKKFKNAKAEYNKHFADKDEKYFNELDLKSKNKVYDVVDRMQVLVSFQDHDIDLVYKFTQGTLGVVTTLSQYEIVASSFAFEHPISEFIDLNEVLKEKDNKDMHVTFFGFGRINQEVFKKIVYGYQLWGDNVHKINYHIADMESEALSVQFVNEYSRPLGNESGDLPRAHMYNIDAIFNGEDLNNEQRLRDYVKEIAPKRFKANGFELFIVSTGSPSNSLRFARILQRALHDALTSEQAKKCYILACGAGNQEVCDLFDASKDKMLPTIRTFGSDSVIADYIDNRYQPFNDLAIGAQKAYRSKTMSTKYKDEVLFFTERLMWKTNSKTDILDNVAVIWNLRAKLSLLGYDLVENGGKFEIKQGDKVLSKEEFAKVFDSHFKNKYEECDEIGKTIAEMEHNRWLIASYLSKRYERRPLSDFLKDFKSKNAEKTSNICMTTNEGLRKIYSDGVKANKDKEESLNNLTYRYDTNALREIFSSLDNMK